MDLIDSLIKEGWLKTPIIIEAFRKIKRADFLPEDTKDLAELNDALSIGWGQTISQPLVVAFMLELLAPEKGEKTLDVGSGSGWTSALLGEIVGERGKVIAIELIPELKEFGEKNVAKYNFAEKGIVKFISGDGSKGYKKEAPFDKILASAALAATKVGSKNQDSSLALTDVRVKEDLSSLTMAQKLPRAWQEQLKIGGRIVTPIGNSIWLFIKKSQEEGDEPSVHLNSVQKDLVFEEKEYPGFVFVPLIEK